MPQQLTTLIEQRLDDMTRLEKTIAHYFIHLDHQESDLTQETVCKVLHLSPSALTRFAKKCGFSGYREFVFEWQKSRQAADQDFEHIHKSLTKRVLVDYNAIISMTNLLVDEEKLEHIAQLIDQSKRVYFYGIGSSGLVAMEIKSRFLRLGLFCEAVTDYSNLRWTTNILDNSCLVIGLSLSGQTDEVLTNLALAAEKGIPTALLTSKPLADERYGHIIPVASVRNLNYGNRISPQIPLLMMIDILYAYFQAIDKDKKESIFQHTIDG